MQVLVVLADAAGQVVTRGTLFDRCWGGVFVGDDSLNRAIAAVRKLATEIAGGSFEVETIPRTGYRLTSSSAETLGAEEDARVVLSRRALVTGSVGLSLLAAGGWWWSSTRSDAQFERLVEAGEDAIRHETIDEKTVRMLEQAVSLRPDSAKAWGLLALVRSLLIRDEGGSGHEPRTVTEAEDTARKGLSLDPNEPNALLAMFELQGSTLDWIARDRSLRRIAAAAPRNLLALSELTALTSATGLTRESWTWNESALALDPLNSLFLGLRAMKLWVFGRTAEADKVIDQLRALYPDDPWVWFVRVQIYAFTGRALAALGLLDSDPTPHGPSPMANLWRASLPAIVDRSTANIVKAREAAVRAVRGSVMAGNEAILLLSELGELDTAFDIANGTLLSRGPLVPPEKPGTDYEASKNAIWRIGTQWMWAPPVAAMRADPRFLALCDGVGLTDYWRRRGVRPDYMRSATLKTRPSAAK
jgi:tetratricopeptide (TPR) repeat protein